MPRITVWRGWGEGDMLQVSVDADASYPDALNEAGAQAVKRFREVHAHVLEAEAPHTEDG